MSNHFLLMGLKYMGRWFLLCYMNWMVPSLIYSRICCGTKVLISSMKDAFAKFPSEAFSEALLLSLSAMGLDENAFLI